MGATGAAPVDTAVWRAAWLCLRVGAGRGTCRCFLELLEKLDKNLVNLAYPGFYTALVMCNLSSLEP
ncbi:hypothetical protein UY3_10474 [Chelonia mydas]|uniref:Uncharacterized protein n=1 Tax=Chelonia mydas TaxID=8469 RepID=M7BWA4_CHEMY|nr:hypothetical protein UY3_10474 [Chelonia mydas]